MTKELENINTLLMEHQDEYKKFTRLILAFSVGFVTFISASTHNELFSIYQKLGITFHCVSILFGMWLQYIILYLPLTDIDRYVKHLKERTPDDIRNGMFVQFKPSIKQTIVFHLQTSFFIIAFFIVSAGVIYNA